METTTNYGLAKPSPDDFYDIEIQNGNMEKVDEALEAKASKENPTFIGKVLIPQPSETPEENEAATVKFVQENGGGTAAGVHISPETAEATGASEKNVESALNAVGGRLGELETDKEEIKRVLLTGFVDGSKTFSDDGTVITSIAADGRKLVKTFTDGFMTMTNVLTDSSGSETARMVKTFDTSGKLIETVVAYSQD